MIFSSMIILYDMIIITIYNTVILVRSVIKFLDRKFSLYREGSSLFRSKKARTFEKNFIARRAKIIVL